MALPVGQKGTRTVRSLLVAMDETPGSEAARHIALVLALEAGACLASFGNLDVAGLTATTAVPLGGIHSKARGDIQRIREVDAHRERARAQFLSGAGAAGVRATTLLTSGDATKELLAAAAAHDAIVMGLDADFAAAPAVGLAPTVEHLLKHNPRRSF